MGGGMNIIELAQLRVELSNPAIGSKDHLRKLALSLVEALEKAQQERENWRTSFDNERFRADKLKAHIEEMTEEQTASINELSRIIQREIKAKREAEKRIAELESRTVTVKLPPELYTIGELIRTQDNRITDQPIFVVFQKREIIGSDEHSPSRICWVWDGEEVSELRAKRLEALYQDGRDTRGYDRYAMQEVDEFVTACFTEHGCKDYLRQNGHNLRLPYIYACGSFRNNEYQLVRNWLAGIKVEAE
ncbi:ead/Ea22-like family protein [Klebsiella michiganensis]|nr:ead/Ea22-like family protein [Klebsiella michiganensis]MBZ7357710.1 ead/Ea22-like family protein [Klebsiella michiganensis]